MAADINSSKARVLFIIRYVFHISQDNRRYWATKTERVSLQSWHRRDSELELEFSRRNVSYI